MHLANIITTLTTMNVPRELSTYTTTITSASVPSAVPDNGVHAQAGEMILAKSKISNKWSLDMSQYRPESMITGDEGVEIWDVSGCTALFFLSDTSLSAYHIEAGKEKEQVAWATNNAKQEGSPNRVILYAPRYSENDREKEALVIDVIKANSDITDINQNGYWIDTGNRNQRFAFFATPPDWVIGQDEYDNGEDPPDW